MGMSCERWLEGRDCRPFELQLALGLRLIKTAALAHRASRKELSESLFQETQREFLSLQAGFQKLDAADRAAFESEMEELRDRIEEYQRLVNMQRPPLARARHASGARNETHGD